jgi:hypothetical protein
VFGGWQVQTQQLYFDSVCRVLGGRVRPCVLKTEVDELVIDVVGIRVVPQRVVGGCRQRAHGTVTVDVRSDRVRQTLEELARSRAAVVLERPGGCALEMRCCELLPARCEQLDAGMAPSATMTFSWHAP